jgi:hypothetical protein
MRFTADRSETLRFFPPTDGTSGYLYVSQSVACKMATVHEPARCVRWLFETKSITQTQLNGSAETVQCLGLHVHQT